jgi:hypothetical protein
MRRNDIDPKDVSIEDAIRDLFADPKARLLIANPDDDLVEHRVGLRDHPYAQMRWGGYEAVGAALAAIMWQNPPKQATADLIAMGDKRAPSAWGTAIAKGIVVA